MTTAVVIGGGVSGLAAAHYLRKNSKFAKILVFEASSRLGGWLQSVQHPDGAVLELGPRSIRPAGRAGKNTLELVSLGALFKVQKPFSRPLISYIIKEVFQKRSTVEDESIYDFIERRMGKEITSKLVKQARLEKWSTYSFRRGVLQLVNALEESLRQTKGTEIHTNTPCSKLHFTSDGKLVVSVNGEEVKAEHVFSSIYAKNLSQIMSKDHSSLATDLRKIPAVNVVVVCVEIAGKPNLIESGFGHLLPSSEDGKLLGVVYDSCVFPQHNRQDMPSSRFTVMMGGAWYEELRGKSDQELQELAISSLFTQLGISGTVTKVKVALMKECIPQYLVGHHQLLEKIFTYIKDRDLPLSLVGSSYRGPSINDCINNARLEVERISKHYC
ncbi:hypothetical protein ACJMK2_019085 [Sinanodonta woodiana]|uniref:Protoporphyrinogen oxidase n=1 Tax=Sinanodonta woodiana TaxID=1069815 RepID=A0ABD3UIY9_SINWO